VGKRSGNGFVAHKAMLVNALSRALSDRVMLMDFTIGRRGFVNYLKALGGSNIVKVIPNGSASEGRTADKRLKVICGANTSYLADSEWIGDKTPMTFCEVRVSPNNTVKPNVGSLELSEAIARVLPFTSTEDTRPVLACVNFVAKDGKLLLVSADGFRLAVVNLDYDDGEGQALVNRDDLKGIVSALKRAKRARVSFEAGGQSIGGYSLIIDTELIRYKWVSVNADYPDYKKLIPTDFTTYASFDTVEAIKAISSLKVLADSKSYPIDLTIGNGKIVLANPDDKGQADIPADTDGEGYVRIDGSYLDSILKACGGMVDFSLANALSPMLFSHNGYKVVVMPMVTDKAQKEAKDKATAKAEPVAEPTEPEATEPVAEPVKPKKAKRSRKKEKVAVA